LSARTDAAGAPAPTLGLIAPSGALADPALVDRAVERLGARGWNVRVGAGATRRFQRFAGTDAERLAELQAWCCDRSLDVLVAVRGGYGMSRLLAQIDFEAIRRAGRIIAGFSDFTAFSLAYLARADGISFQGPGIADLAADDGADFTRARFLATIAAPELALRFATGSAPLAVEGRLWGGNLAMVCALLGTPYFPDVRGGILVLEDVSEPAYRVERMLYQLAHAGVLDKQGALVLGDFDGPPAAPSDGGYDIGAAIAQIRAIVGIPVVTGLHFGHGARRVTMPIGAPARLQVADGEALLQVTGYPSLAGAPT
jgi:muramoyltetrapeptide carboxypeptidase